MNRSTKTQVAINIILASCTFFACFTIGYFIVNFIFVYFGYEKGIYSYLISVFFGMFVFAMVAKLASEIFRHSKIGKEHIQKRLHFLESMIEALNKISRGDFNISIDAHEHDPFAEMAESVNKMARELSSMESQRQDFISNVSHEIQSPLTSISGFAALLKADTLTREQRDHYIEIIETESKRLSKLSENLLKLSSLESESTPLLCTSYRLDKQLEHSILVLEPHWIKKKIEIEVDLEKINLSADKELMGQVWMNLIHNAVKFTPENGVIRVELFENDYEIQCHISDDGIGISKEDQIHIFERFYKADKSRDRSLGGNGLGLSLCKKIVQLHNGEITLESELDKGTKFIVSLPK